VLYDLGRQPRSAHDFFVKYQDRILFGKDSFQPGEYPSYWRVFEARDEYFDYYRDYHACWKMCGMGLPDDVLKKLYFGNVVRIADERPAAARRSAQRRPRLQVNVSDRRLMEIDAGSGSTSGDRFPGARRNAIRPASRSNGVGPSRASMFITDGRDATC
jgi:hypothetical protein